MIGDRLKLFRTQNKLNQQHLADVLGVDRSTYCSYESGRRKASIEILSRLANFYRVPVDVLINEEILNVADDGYESDDTMYLSQLSKDERELIVYYRLAQKENKEDVINLLKENSKE